MTHEDFDIDRTLPAKRGRALTFDQWQKLYLYFESEGGAFDDGQKHKFPDGVNIAGTYSKCLAVNN